MGCILGLFHNWGTWGEPLRYTLKQGESTSEGYAQMRMCDNCGKVEYSRVKVKGFLRLEDTK